MEIKKLAGIYQLKTTQFVDAPIEEVWDFFSKPANLETITPDNLNFSIRSETSDVMRGGDIISYKIQIFPLIKSSWLTEIKHVEHQRAFVDEQRIGPYKIWHHRHTFEATDGGTLMTDEIHFLPPFPKLSGFLVHLMIKPKLIEIFSHRKVVVDQLFNTPKTK